jgi:hypothetical protein
MNDSASPRPRRWRRVLLWSSAVFVAALVIVAIAAINLVTLSRDAAALRQVFVAGAPGALRPQVQIDAGPATLALARLVVGCIDDVPAEARQALRAVRAASVGVYEADRSELGPWRTGLMAAADDKMTRRGWTRIVGVRDGRQVVLVYVPADSSARGTQRFCVAVCDQRQLVVVSGAADADALVALAERHGGKIRL